MSHASPSPDHTGTTAAGVSDDALAGLRRWNLGLTVLHAAQAVAVLVPDHRSGQI